jgi:hypothetical protein
VEIVMKRLLFLGILGVAATCPAPVFLNGPFATPPVWIESYDSLPNGGSNTIPMFGGWGVGNRIGTNGQLWVGPPPVWNVTAPNSLYGRGVDVEIVALIPMRRFGGMFARMPPGLVQSPVGTFTFYDNSNNVIGSVTVPISANFTWRGFRTFPRWKRVEIIGSSPIPGHIAMDQTRIRWW